MAAEFHSAWRGEPAYYWAEVIAGTRTLDVMLNEEFFFERFSFWWRKLHSGGDERYKSDMNAVCQRLELQFHDLVNSVLERLEIVEDLEPTLHGSADGPAE